MDPLLHEWYAPREQAPAAPLTRDRRNDTVHYGQVADVGHGTASLRAVEERTKATGRRSVDTMRHYRGISHDTCSDEAGRNDGRRHQLQRGVTGRRPRPGKERRQFAPQRFRAHHRAVPGPRVTSRILMAASGGDKHGARYSTPMSQAC